MCLKFKPISSTIHIIKPIILLFHWTVLVFYMFWFKQTKEVKSVLRH